MYKIGLIEIKCVNHEISGLCKISNTKRNKVTVFATKPIFEVARVELADEVDNYEWIIKEENEGILSFLKRIEKICNDRIDLVIVNSLRRWQFLFFKPKCKMICAIYDLNYWFRDTKSLKIYFEKIKEFRNITNRNWIANAVVGPFIRKYILLNYDGILVEYPPFKQYVHDNFKYNKKVYFFPKRPFQNITFLKSSPKLRFVIPGMVQESRRDYETVLKAFEKVLPKHNQSIELYLLGRPMGKYSDGVISFCEKLKEKGYNVYYFKEYIPYELFNKVFIKSDIIISPLKIRYKSRCVEEIYSVTKGTGTFNDSIKYAKPVIVPKTYNIADEIKTSYLTYKDEKDLERLLETLICDREKLETLKREAINNSKKFSLEKLYIEFNKMVEEILFGKDINQKQE